MAMRSTLTLNLGATKAALRTAAAAGLKVGAEVVLAESRKVVPIEEATLSRSGATDVDEATLTASVSYDTPYAVRQHEELDYRHDEGRQAKYLEGPLLEHRDQALAAIAQTIRGRLA
ncbi:hypothetical protein [Sanguibacter sp. HDW7]|uniref:hypothetical protein n=1 Tax=Sanguibacter sp. HDW7 TaxID=2714931 RepID=UPI00140CE45E|nr:hypothetical protein [Sanguibacter sp. HDW7]QIK82988.1 hypothetical protein G7063_04615 [Sanguibacter sp. HDW7]